MLPCQESLKPVVVGFIKPPPPPPPSNFDARAFLNLSESSLGAVHRGDERLSLQISDCFLHNISVSRGPKGCSCCVEHYDDHHELMRSMCQTQQALNITVVIRKALFHHFI